MQQRKDIEDLPSETAAGRDRSETELEMTEEVGAQGSKGGERSGDLNAQTPGLDRESGGKSGSGGQ